MYPHYRPLRPTGDVNARVHIYTAKALQRGSVALSYAWPLLPRGKVLGTDFIGG